MEYSRSKHFGIYTQFIREQIAECLFTAEYVSTSQIKAAIYSGLR